MLKLIKVCIAQRGAWCIENPERSFLWDARATSPLPKLPGSGYATFDACKFEGKSRKPIGIPSWNNNLFTMTLDSPRCIAKGPTDRCSRTRGKHVTLRGVDPESSHFCSSKRSRSLLPTSHTSLPSGAVLARNLAHGQATNRTPRISPRRFRRPR